MVRPSAAAVPRRATATARWSGDEAFGDGLRRGAVCGATVAAVAGAALAMASGGERGFVFVMVTVAVLVGSVTGVGCAAGALLVLGAGDRRGAGVGWGLSVLAAGVAAVLGMLATGLVLLVAGGWDLVPDAVVGIGAVTGALALWQIRRMTRS